MTIIQNPAQFKIPAWFLNRQRDIVDGKSYQVLSNGLDSKLREDLERLKKIRAHRGLRHYWGLRVRGQHTKTTGRRGKTVGGTSLSLFQLLSLSSRSLLSACISYLCLCSIQEEMIARSVLTSVTQLSTLYWIT